QHCARLMLSCSSSVDQYERRARGASAVAACSHIECRATQRGYRVYLMLTHVFVGARSLICEELRVVFRNAGHDLEVRARNQHLPAAGEAHNALGDVDAVADDIGLSVDVRHQAHWTEVDADAHFNAGVGSFSRQGERLREADGNEQG